MTIQKLPRSVQKMVPIVALALAASVGLPAAAQDASGPILFTNVNVFDGVNEALIENANVVVTDNLITAVSTEPLAIAGGTVIDGGGRTLMPGLTDCHWRAPSFCTSRNRFSCGVFITRIPHRRCRIEIDVISLPFQPADDPQALWPRQSPARSPSSHSARAELRTRG